ncbi:MAG: DUF1007 family protein [Rhodospirillaceae bacterium]|nr:DUF1007 family protein [Rhodospirillaceae bacterium]MCY4065448.1 DUF1007 family protein [Rhodospirillaceae bacterium]
MRILLIVAILLAGAVGTIRPAAAHPHIFIDARAIFHMERGKVVAITQHWTFDAVFGGVVIHAFDRNRDGKLDAGEAEQVRRGAFDALKGLNYFTVVRIGREELKLDRVTGFAASVVDGRLAYRFKVALPRPVDPRADNPAFLFVDKTYYVAVELQKQSPVTFAGAAPAGCRTVMRDDFENPIYFDLVVPRMLNFDCPAG